jgi:uncharacterized protein YxjI
MTDILQRNDFLVEEGAALRAAFSFDIRDPETGDALLECREPPLSGLTKVLRFSDLKRTTPFHLDVFTPEGLQVMKISRGVPIMVSCVEVFDAEGVPIGGFRQKPFSIAGAFDVLDAQGQQVCRLQGKATGTEFSFVAPDNIVLAKISKQWAGIRKELLTSADNYLLSIEEAVPDDNTIRSLILASAICISMVVKFRLP